MKSSIIIGTIVIGVILIIGCQMLEDKIMPVHISKDLSKYTGHDPNNIGYESLEKLKDFSNKAQLTHQLTQAEVEYLAKKDNVTYTLVSAVSTETIKEAEQEKQAIFGQGGIASMIISALLGGGGTMAVLSKIWYTETEHQAALDAVQQQPVTQVSPSATTSA
jgi:hypothetical protein